MLEKGVLIGYINMIKGLKDGAVINVRSTDGNSIELTIIIG